MVKITVDLNKCNSDGICVDVCPSGVYELNNEGKSVPVNPDECIELFDFIILLMTSTCYLPNER